MKKLMAYTLFMVMIVYAQPDNRIKVGLALRGGGALGFAHIGSLAVIDSLEIPVDYVAGTSMGGLVGALYCMGFSAVEMEEFVLSIDWNDIFNDKPSRDYLPYLIKKNSGKYLMELAITGLAPTLPKGLIAGQKIYETFFKITYPFEGIRSFDDLPIPFRCIGADLVSGEEVIFSDGSLAKAMRATMSIPTVFDPVRYEDALIIDGGMTNNFPVDVIKTMGSNFLIGLNLVSPQKSADDYDDLLKILDRTLDVPRQEKLQQTIDMADLLIEQDIAGYSLSDFDTLSIKDIIQRGRAAAYDKIDELVSLKDNILSQMKLPSNRIIKLVTKIEISGNSDISKSQLEKILYVKEGKEFSLAKMNGRLEKFNHSTILADMKVSVKENGANSVQLFVQINQIYSPIVKDITINGNVEMTDEFILNFLGLRAGRKIELREFEHRISSLYALNYFTVIRQTIDQNADRTISLNLEIVEKSPYSFFLGLHYDDFYKLVGVIGFRINSVLLPGLMIDTELQFSGLTRFRTDIFYPSRSLEFPLYPILTFGYQNTPRDVFSTTGSKELRYNDTEWYLGGGLGLSPTRFINLTGKLMLEYPNIQLNIGNIDTIDRRYRDEIVSTQFNFDLDALDNLVVPKNGLKLNALLEISAKNFGSVYNYIRLESYFDLYYTLMNNHTFRFSGSYLRSWENDPFFKTLFFIGGPVSFFGLDYSQGMGTEFLTFRIDYRWEFIKKLFVKGIVNASPQYRIGVPDNKISGKTLWGFGFGIMYDSILGPIEISFSWGDKTPYDPGIYVSRIYFSAGYLL